MRVNIQGRAILKNKLNETQQNINEEVNELNDYIVAGTKRLNEHLENYKVSNNLKGKVVPFTTAQYSALLKRRLNKRS